MKKFILSALCAIAALAGCQKIDENSVNPGQSGLKVTAVIADNSTKVDYEVVDNTVNPTWKVDDQIFGYDGTGTFTFTVTDVDENGVATFDAGDYTPTDGTILYAVYYPAESADNFTSGELAVDLTSQDGVLDGKAPAIMCATATVESGEVIFHFYNQTAIIGVNKFQTNPNELINTFKASGLVATGTIKVVGEALALVPDTTPADMTIACNYAADATTGMYENPVYFIAMPTESAAIDIKATSSKGTEGIYSTPTAVNANILAGNYYYMSKKLASEHVARYTNDGGTSWTYTESLADAIGGIAAATAKEDGMVELLKNDAIGASELPALTGKAFTLNGNGHTYDISARTKEFATDASTDVTFDDIVIDGKSADNGNRFIYNNGKITFADGAELKNVIFKNASSGACGIIYNNYTGELNINGAYIHDIKSMTSVTDGGVSGGFAANYGGVINMTAGTVENISCVGSNTSVRGAFAYNTYSNSIKATINITGGTFKGLSSNCGGLIYTYAGNVNISNATISDCYSNNMGGAFYFYGYSSTWNTTVNITNTTFDNCSAKGTDNGYSGLFAVSNNANVTLDGCTISNCSSKTYGGAIAVLAATSILNIQNGTSISNCSASTYGGAIYSANGTSTIKGSSISGCSANSGGTFYLSGGTVNVKDNSTINGTNAYVSTAGTLNITNSTYKYTGTGYALYVYGSSDSGKNKGTINVNGGSVIKATSASGAYAYYGNINITEDSQIIAKGSYGIYMTTGGKITCTNAIVLNSGTGYAFFSGTGNNASSMTINSGYYATNGSTVSATSGSYTKRITVNGGYFNKNTVNGTNFGTGITVKSITPVSKKTIDGTEYTFGFQAKS